MGIAKCNHFGRSGDVIDSTTLVHVHRTTVIKKWQKKKRFRFFAVEIDAQDCEKRKASTVTEVQKAKKVPRKIHGNG